MKLLKQKSRDYEGKAYYKYWVIIPNKLVAALGWKKGEELDVEIKDKKLVIEKD